MSKLVRSVLAATVAAVVLAAVPGAAQVAEQPRWIAAWGAPAGGSETVAPADSSVRNIARISLNGDKVRIRVSNALGGDTPLVIGAASIARQEGTEGAAITPGTSVPITFGGQPGVTVPGGTDYVYSDPVDFPAEANTNVAVSLYLPEETNPSAPGSQWNTSYTTAAGAGDTTAEEGGESFTEPIDVTYALTAVDVLTAEANAAIVGLGSSTLHGYNSTRDGYDRVLDLFITRNQNEVPVGLRKGIVGAGIGGDTLHGALADGRLERDVLSHSGVGGVVIWVTNDLTTRTAEQIIADYRIVIARSHARGVRAYCPTWMPGAQSIGARAERAALNEWIINSGECDDVVDWDRVVRNDAAPDTFKPEYFSDGIHPNAAGHAAMSEATPVRWFTALRLRPGFCGDVAPLTYEDRAEVLAAHRHSVECATAITIVRGFGDNTYRPAAPVRRDEMATFLVQAMDTAEAVQELPPPEDSQDTFGDIEGNRHEANIRRLFAAGLVSGLDDEHYGPAQAVTRDQMATFLLRAAEFANGLEKGSLESEEQAFDDVGRNNAHFTTVNGAAVHGLVFGRAPDAYEPLRRTRRDQMATFVLRLMSLINGKTLVAAEE